nr:MAG TPA: hypothetical protein [Caudoviricetes sp.]
MFKRLPIRESQTRRARKVLVKNLRSIIILILITDNSGQIER